MTGTYNNKQKSGSSNSPFRHFLARHALVAGIGFGFVTLFWLSRLEWNAEMRLWRAMGDAAFLMLFFALVSGPVTRLWPRASRILKWRRELGIWFVLLALVHAFLIWDGWAKWDILRFLGYEYVEPLDRVVRLEPGFGLANLLGVVALSWGVVLLLTSSDRMLRALGPSTWKWIQSSAYIVFYLVALHAAYYLFIHYTPSFHRDIPPANWFQWPFLVLVFVVIGLQVAAAWKTVRISRHSRHESIL